MSEIDLFSGSLVVACYSINHACGKPLGKRWIITFTLDI